MTNEEVLRKFNQDKILKLVAALFIDLIGYISYLIPGIAEITDVFWAPISAILIFALFKKSWKVALGGAVVGGLEELSTGLDFIPTATFVWVVVYVKDKEKTLKGYVENKKREEEIISNFQKKIEDKWNKWLFYTETINFNLM